MTAIILRAWGEWRALRHLYEQWAEPVLNRPALLWSQTVELAELCWHWHHKQWREPPSYELTDQLEGLMGYKSPSTYNRTSGYKQ